MRSSNWPGKPGGKGLVAPLRPGRAELAGAVSRDWEAEAARLRDFQSMVLPGLVQTEDYTRAILRAAPGAGCRADDIEQQVALRMERQAVLDGAAPPELRLVLSEGALRVQVGGPEVMRAQLRKLAEVAGRSQVTLPGARHGRRGGSRAGGQPVHHPRLRPPR